MNPPSPSGVPLCRQGEAACPQAAAGAVGTSRPASITVRNLRRRWPVDTRLLRSIGEAALEALGFTNGAPTPRPAAQVAVFLVGARRMAFLNERFLGHAGPTDAITFDYAGPLPVPQLLHGDIFICLEEARRQARAFGTTWQADVVRYLVHGLLHLSGHDDLEAGARRRMKRVEDRIVRRLVAGFAFKRLGRGPIVSA